MNKLIKLTLCFMVNICAGFEFTDSDEKPTDPSMWCAPEKRDEFKQLCNSEIANLNANSDSESDSDDSSANYDKTYLLMNIFSEKLKDKEIVEEYKLQIPQNMLCNIECYQHNAMKDFIKLTKHHYETYQENLIIEKLNISSPHIVSIAKDIWKDANTYLQINKCTISGRYSEINLQYFPCNQYDFTNVNCQSVFLPIMPQCDIYACESQITIKIDESEYNADNQYCANITHIYIPQSTSPSAASVISSAASNASSYREQFYINMSKISIKNLNITQTDTVKDDIPIAQTTDQVSAHSIPAQSQCASLSPRSSVPSPTASELRGNSKSASPTSHKSSEKGVSFSQTMDSPLPVGMPALDMNKIIRNEDENSESSEVQSDAHTDYAALPPSTAEAHEAANSTSTSPQQDKMSEHSGQTLIVDTNSGLLNPSTAEAHEANSTTHSDESANIEHSSVLEETMETAHKDIVLETVNQPSESTSLLNNKSTKPSPKKNAPAQQESTCCCSIS